MTMKLLTCIPSSPVLHRWTSSTQASFRNVPLLQSQSFQQVDLQACQTFFPSFLMEICIVMVEKVIYYQL